MRTDGYGSPSIYVTYEEGGWGSLLFYEGDKKESAARRGRALYGGV